MAWKSRFRKWDMFRKVPNDLTEGSSFGTFLSIICYIAVTVLVVFEFNNYLTVETKTDYVIEQHRDEFIRINFDITMSKLSCEYASLDVVNQMGTHKINVTQNIRRWQVYDNGYTREITPLELDAELGNQDNMQVEQISTLIKGSADFQRITNAKPVVMVNFYAPWCHWCQALAPIYEGAAQRIQQGALSAAVTMAKVDCTNSLNFDLCTSNNIKGYPTIIVYTPFATNKFVHYHEQRTVDSIVSFLKNLVPNSGMAVSSNVQPLNITAAQEGCRLKGSIVVPRMSGNFHISCHGSHAYLLPLSFGEVLKPYEMESVPPQILEGMNVLKEKHYPVFTTNTSYEHILKVFPTQIIHKNEVIDMFQYTSDSGMGISDEDIPEATFSFEFDPLTIVMSDVIKPFYHFITSLFAIIGGVVTLISFIDSIFNRAEAIFQEKMNLGKAE